MNNRGLRSGLFGLACLLILAAYAVAGLGPFHAPANLVEWRMGGQGVHFGAYGTILSRQPFRQGLPVEQQACSLEFWLAPSLIDDWNTLVAWYDPNTRMQVSFHQMARDFAIEESWRGRGSDPPLHWIFLPGVFHADKPSFISITSDGAKVSIFVDGILRRESTDLPFTLRDLVNRMVVFDSPRSTSSFGGDWLGLAIYNAALSSNRVNLHYHSWVTSRRPEITSEDHALALFLFDEGSGKIVHNRLGTGDDLTIPDRYTVLDKVWFQRKMPSIYGWKDLAVNLTGFMPFGFCLYGFLASRSSTSPSSLRTVVLATLGGFCVSMMIEFFQGWLPTRDSDLTDVVTNTLGTFLGVLVYCHSPLQMRLFEVLGRLLPRLSVAQAE